MAAPMAGRGLAASGNVRNSEQFPDPFCDIASMAFPENIQEALAWCEFILSKNGPYREALSRVLSYFITDIEIVSADPQKRLGQQEKQKYLDFLYDTIGIREELYNVGLDYLGYGNSFTSILIPFRRYLSCPKCGLESPLKHVHNNPTFGFEWSGFDFHANCPHCRYSGKFRHVDRRSGEKDKLKIKRWSPHEIDILWDPLTHDRSYIWKIPEDYRGLIRRGRLFHLERAGWEVVQAIKTNDNLLFDSDAIYHMAVPGMAGHRMRGWGLSRVLINFALAWYYQVLQRQTEAIALDFVTPFRLLTPMPRPGADQSTGDPAMTHNLGGFTQRVERMLGKRRQDPARWNVLPFPVQYQALGGDASQFAPTELIELAHNMLLNSIGVPVELYSANLSMQAAPPALRLFEANWGYLVHALNRFLGHVCEKVSQVMSWEPVIAKMTRVKHADDLNRQMAVLQLAMGGVVSKTTALKMLGIDNTEETRTKLEEQRIEAEETQKTQKEMEQAAQMDEMAQPIPPGQTQTGSPTPQGGQPAPGAPQGAPPAGGMQGAGAAPAGPMGQPMDPYGAVMGFMMQQPSGPVPSLDEMQAKATAIAQQLMMMGESQKDSTLIKIRSQDETLHLLVKSKYEAMKEEQKKQNEARGAQMAGPEGGGAPPGGPPPGGDPAAKQAEFTRRFGRLSRAIVT